MTTPVCSYYLQDDVKLFISRNGSIDVLFVMVVTMISDHVWITPTMIKDAVHTVIANDIGRGYDGKITPIFQESELLYAILIPKSTVAAAPQEANAVDASPLAGRSTTTQPSAAIWDATNNTNSSCKSNRFLINKKTLVMVL